MRVMSKKKYPLFAIVLLGSFLVGCVDDFDRNFEFDEYTPSVLIEAKQFIESGNVTVSLLDMGRAYMSESEKSIKANAKADFSIQWSDYRIITEGKEDVVYVPIKVNKKKQQAFSLLTDDGRIKGYSHQIYYAMLLFPGVNGSGFDAVMATYLYGHNMKESDVKRMGRNFESAGYTGYYITSCLDGTMLAGRYVEDGETKIGFRQNPLSPKERKKQTAESDTAKKHNHDHHHLFLNINPQKYVKQTRSGGHDMEWIMTHCPLCEELWDDCQCNIVYPKCSYCGTDVISNRCSYACTRCDVCMYGNPSHTHNTPPSYPPLNPGTGGGGGPSGPTPDPDPDPDPDPEPDPEPVVNHTFEETVYITASQNAYSIIDAAHPNEPACSDGVREMSKQLFDGLVLDELIGNANTIYNNLEASNRWQKIDFTQANYYANQGYFVVAAWNSGSAEMGHVDTILPGHTGEGWNSIYVMDTGWAPWTNTYGQSGNSRSQDQTITNSFGKKKRTGESGSFGIYYYK